MAWIQFRFDKIQLAKGFMKITKLVTLILLLIPIIWASNPDRSKKKQNVDQFKLHAIPVEQISVDSIGLIVYFDIPNSSLQFTKVDTIFSASFEAIISLRDDDDQQITRHIWTGNVNVSDYRASISNKLFTTLHTKIYVPSQELLIYGELFDKETRSSGDQELEISLTEFADDAILLPLRILKKRTGDWGIGEDLMPVLDGRILMEDNDYHLYACAKIDTGRYKLSVITMDNSDSIKWRQSYNLFTSTGIVKETIAIPEEILSSFNLKFTVMIHQNSIKLNKSYTVRIVNPGLPVSIRNLEEAIDQLQYLATNEERQKFKKAPKNQLEQLLREFWESRDPTPNTIKNELMDEYYKRVRYANAQFSTFMPGWRSDMGMIFIIFGPPGEIERLYTSSTRYSGQKWYYYNINRTFIFIDTTGFGDFRLSTPYLRQSSW